ncbi:MAG: hypothetical protein HRT42_00645 [Campylobacteraceae bacterium]|nr:hypothetical protein [Campylobacteraceae bacterium]
MEMLLNENDIVVGASFTNGTIQDYINEEKTYGLLRHEETTVFWFLFNKIESTDDVKELYSHIIKEEHFIHDDHGEEIVLFNKQGDKKFEDLVKLIDDYLNDELG